MAMESMRRSQMASSCCSGGQAGMGHVWATVGLKEGLGGAIFMDILGES